MKNKLILYLFLLLSCASACAMDSSAIPDSVSFITSDRCNVALTRDELSRLKSNLLGGLFEEISYLSEDIHLGNVDVIHFNFLKRLINEEDKDVVLFSYKEKFACWDDLLDVLQYLEMSEWLTFVCKWIVDHEDFSSFDGKKIIRGKSVFLQSLADELIKKLSSSKLAWRLLSDESVLRERRGSRSGVSCVAVAHDDSFIATGSNNGTVRIWRLNEDHKLIDDYPIVLRGHSRGVCSVAIAHDDSFIVTGSWDGSARIWRLNEDHKLIDDRSIELADHRGFIVIAIAHDDSFIVTGSDFGAKMWSLDRATHQLLTSRILPPMARAVGSIKIAHDDSFIIGALATGADYFYDFGIRTAVLNKGFVVRWRLDSQHMPINERPLRIYEYDRRHIGGIALAQDDSFLVTRYTTGDALKDGSSGHIWRFGRGDRVRCQRGEISAENPRCDRFAITLAHDDSFVVAGRYLQKLNERHEITGKSIKLVGHEVSSLAIAHDGSFIVTGSAKDKRVQLFRLNEEHHMRDGEPLILSGHTGSVEAVAVAYDDSFVVTGSADGTARIWNIKNFPHLLSSLNDPQLLLFLKLSISSKPLNVKESPEIKEIYESLPERFKKVFDEHNESLGFIPTFGRRLKGHEDLIHGIGNGMIVAGVFWTLYKFMRG